MENQSRTQYYICLPHIVLTYNWPMFLKKVEISEISLDQSGNTSDRKLAFVDKNRDLYIINVRTPGNSRRTYKIGI